MGTLREKRQLEIIEAAIKVFRSYGFHKAKIGEIAKTAGIGKGTIYEYFDSKKDLFEEMMRYIATTYFNLAKEAIEGNVTVREKLIAFARHHGSFINNHIDLAENNMPEPGFLSEKMKCEMLEKKKSIFLLLDKALDEGIQSGEIRLDINKRIAISTIIGAINQNYAMHVYFERLNPDEVDPTPIIDIILNGLNK